MGKRNKLINNHLKKKKGNNNKNNKNNKNKITPKKIIVIGILFTVIGLTIYGGINSLKSFNGNFLLSPPRNYFMKATYLPNEGNVYTSQSTGTAKILNSGAGSSKISGHNPTIRLRAYPKNR
jgi:hypothetical protein